MHRSHHHRGRRGPPSRAEPPRTYEEAIVVFQELGLGLIVPPVLDSDQERAAIEQELRLIPQYPRPWTGTVRDWRELSYVLSETIRDIRNPPSPESSSEEDLDFDDDWTYLPPAGDASHRPVASHRTDHVGGHPSYTPPDSASDPGSPESETTPPPPYSRHSGRRNAGGHREAHERTMHQGSRNTGGPREGYDNTRYQGGGDAGGPRARHGNSHYQEGGYAGGSLSAYDYQPSGAFNARSTEAMDRERFPERRRGEWVIDNNSYLDQMPRLNRLLSARRGGG